MKNGIQYLRWLFAWAWLSAVLVVVDGFEKTMERWFK